VQRIEPILPLFHCWVTNSDSALHLDRCFLITNITAGWAVETIHELSLRFNSKTLKNSDGALHLRKP